VSTHTPESSFLTQDTDLLSAIIHELTVARRNVSAYPKGHPVVTGSCDKVVELFNRLFDSRDELTLGIAKDSLSFDGRSFERLTQVVQAFANSLFYHHIAVITFAKGLSAEEIEKFNGILSAKREAITASGGIEAVIRDAGLRNLQIREIRYDDLRVDEDTISGEENEKQESYLPWESLVLEMMQTSTSPLSISPGSDTTMAPQDLLGIIQGHPRNNQLQAMERLALFLGKGSHRGKLLHHEKEAFGKILHFISTLTPELREHFFECVLNALEDNDGPVLDILAKLPGEQVLEAVQRCGKVGRTVPPLLLRMVGKLSSLSVANSASGESTNEAAVEPDGGINGTIETIFRETTGEEFIPRDYQAKLTALISSRDISVPSDGDLAELMETLAYDCIEIAVSDIILESLLLASGEQLETLKRTLSDYCRYFLETGDFNSLNKMHQRLRDGYESADAATASEQGPLALFTDTDFIAEVMNGLSVWGREKFAGISSLIQTVGKPFIEPLLDRLIEEENRLVRKFCLEQLTCLAELAGESVLARLDDSRWYVVRNLLIILQQSGCLDLAMNLRRVAGHSHPKVRQMVIEMYINLQDPEGDRLLLNDLTNEDKMVRLQAIQLAEKSVHPDVVTSLLHILQRKGTSPDAVMEKKAALHSLAEIGDPRALPVLEGILNKWSLFRPSFHLQIKMHILQTLIKYQEPSAFTLLVRTADSRNRELSRKALELVRSHGEDRR
jgi:HEAT repeat protein